MSLKQWADNGWLKPHQTSRKEISSLLRIVERDLDDAQRDISSDWRFGIAYNAALKLCRILLCAEGYRPSYTKVLSKFAGGKGLRITINVEVSPEGGVSKQKIEETKVALRELGLQDDMKVE